MVSLELKIASLFPPFSLAINSFQILPWNCEIPLGTLFHMVKHITYQFLKYKQTNKRTKATRGHLSWSPPRLTVCTRQLMLHNSRVYIYTEYNVNGSLHQHSNEVAQCSGAEFPCTHFLLFPNCISCSPGLMHDCCPGSSIYHCCKYFLYFSLCSVFCFLDFRLFSFLVLYHILVELFSSRFQESIQRM